MTESLYVRARVSLAVAAQEAADLSRGVVGDVSTPMSAVERIRKARRVRLVSLTVVDRAVLAVLSEGASWEEVAEGLGYRDAPGETAVERAKRIHGPTWDQWLLGDLDDDADFGDYGIGLRGDNDMAGTAATLDQWYVRHADYLEPDAAPVTRVFAIDAERAREAQ